MAACVHREKGLYPWLNCLLVLGVVTNSASHLLEQSLNSLAWHAVCRFNATTFHRMHAPGVTHAAPRNCALPHRRDPPTIRRLLAAAHLTGSGQSCDATIFHGTNPGSLSTSDPRGRPDIDMDRRTWLVDSQCWSTSARPAAFQKRALVERHRLLRTMSRRQTFGYSLCASEAQEAR